MRKAMFTGVAILLTPQTSDAGLGFAPMLTIFTVLVGDPYLVGWLNDLEGTPFVWTQLRSSWALRSSHPPAIVATHAPRVCHGVFRVHAAAQRLFPPAGVLVLDQYSEYAGKQATSSASSAKSAATAVHLNSRFSCGRRWESVEFANPMNSQPEAGAHSLQAHLRPPDAPRRQ